MKYDQLDFVKNLKIGHLFMYIVSTRMLRMIPRNFHMVLMWGESSDSLGFSFAVGICMI